MPDVPKHWRETAEYIYWDEKSVWLIGEDDYGDLRVPYRRADIVTRRVYGWVRFNRWNPMHWFRYWNSRRRNQIVFLEFVAAAVPGANK